MEHPRQVDWLHRPTLSARCSDLKEWLTQDRLRVAWRLGKRELSRTSTYPSQDLAFEIGVERRTVYYWMSGEHEPAPLSFVHIDAAFSRVLGEDWKEQVDRALS